MPPATPAPLPDPLPAPPEQPTPRAQLHADSHSEIAPASTCLAGEWCIGPVATLGAINLLGIGAQARSEYVGVGIDYQFMPTLTIADTGARWSLLSLDARVYPFGGSFWLGLGFGYQSFSAQREVDTDYGAVDVRGSLGIPMFKLGLGFMGRSGLVIGIDLNFGIPIGGADLEFEVDSEVARQYEDEPSYQDALDEVRASIDDAADAAVQFMPFIPQLNLFRIGYMF
jgi:hypothetical protein